MFCFPKQKKIICFASVQDIVFSSSVKSWMVLGTDRFCVRGGRGAVRFVKTLQCVEMYSLCNRYFETCTPPPHQPAFG